MKKIILVHGWSGGPNKDWLPWMRKELLKRGYAVLTPEMPDADAPVAEKWVGHLSNIVGEPTKDTYFIGHSIGWQAVLRYLDAHRFGATETVGGAIFVAGWFNLENLETKEEKVIADPWIKTPINPVKIKTVLPQSILIISDDDPYGAFEENKERFEKLGSRVIVLKGAGHMTTEDGFKQFPILLSEAENLLS